MFKVPGQKQIGPDALINERVFDDCCAERGYEPKDRAKLIQLLTERTPKGSGISLYSLQMQKRRYEQRNKQGTSVDQANAKY